MRYWATQTRTALGWGSYWCSPQLASAHLRPRHSADSVVWLCDLCAGTWVTRTATSDASEAMSQGCRARTPSADMAAKACRSGGSAPLQPLPPPTPHQLRMTPVHDCILGPRELLFPHRTPLFCRRTAC